MQPVYRKGLREFWLFRMQDMSLTNLFERLLGEKRLRLPMQSTSQQFPKGIIKGIPSVNSPLFTLAKAQTVESARSTNQESQLMRAPQMPYLLDSAQSPD